MNVGNLCYCNACHSRRVVLNNETLKFEQCSSQQAIDAMFELSRKRDADIAPDAVVEANRKLLLERSKVGVAKYFTTLAAAGLTRRQLLQHALEEALDLANYLQAEIMREDSGNGDESSKPGA